MGGGVIYMLTYFNDGGPSDLFRSEMLAKSWGFFFRSMEDAGILGGWQKKNTKGFWGVY